MHEGRSSRSDRSSLVVTVEKLRRRMTTWRRTGRLFKYACLKSRLVDFFAVANFDDEHDVWRLDGVDNTPVLHTQSACALEAVP